MKHQTEPRMERNGWKKEGQRSLGWTLNGDAAPCGGLIVNRESRGKGEGGDGQMSVTHFACGCGWPSTSLPGLQPPIHPSPLTSLSGCQPCFSTRRQPLAGDRASLVPWQFAGRPLPIVHLRGGRNPASDSTFSTHFWERSDLSFSPLRVRDGNVFMSSPEGQSNHSSDVSADVETNCVQQIKQICFFLWQEDHSRLRHWWSFAVAVEERKHFMRRVNCSTSPSAHGINSH